MKCQVFEVRSHAVVAMLVRPHRAVAFGAAQCRLQWHVECDGYFKVGPAMSCSNFANVSFVGHILNVGRRRPPCKPCLTRQGTLGIQADSLPDGRSDFRWKHVPATFSGMPWPKTVPDDLRRKLEAVLGYRNRPAPQDVWGAVLEWLESIDVEPVKTKGSD